MNIVLIGLYIFIFLIFIRMHIMIKRYKINFKYMFLNYIILVIILLINTPILTNFLIDSLSLRNRYDIMLMVMFVYLMYNNFVLEFHIARLNQDIGKIVSEIAIIKKEENNEY
ncbi:MAG: DUF2304 family protein [Mycoplasmatales bacterium]